MLVYFFICIPTLRIFQNAFVYNLKMLLLDGHIHPLKHLNIGCAQSECTKCPSHHWGELGFVVLVHFGLFFS